MLHSHPTRIEVHLVVIAVEIDAARELIAVAEEDVHALRDGGAELLERGVFIGVNAARFLRRFSGYVRYVGRVRGSSPDPASKCARISTR